jgi:hypothetical protein
MQFWKKADKYEEREMEKLTESHRSAGGHEHPTDTPYERESDGEDLHSTDRSSHTSDHSGDDDKTISSKSSGVKSALELAKTDKNNNLKKLGMQLTGDKRKYCNFHVIGWIMFFTTLFAMAIMFTQLGVLDSQLGNYNAVILSMDGIPLPIHNSK